MELFTLKKKKKSLTCCYKYSDDHHDIVIIIIIVVVTPKFFFVFFLLWRLPTIGAVTVGIYCRWRRYLPSTLCAGDNVQWTSTYIVASASRIIPGDKICPALTICAVKRRHRLSPGDKICRNSDGIHHSSIHEIRRSAWMEEKAALSQPATSPHSWHKKISVSEHPPPPPPLPPRGIPGRSPRLSRSSALIN